MLGLLGFAVLIGIISLINEAADRVFGDSAYFWRIVIVAGVLTVLAIILEGDFRPGVRSLLLGWNAGYTVVGLVVCVLGVEDTLTQTGTVTLPLLGALWLLRYLHSRDNSLAKAAAATLEPTAIGLMISLALVTLFNFFGPSVPVVWMVEKWIARASAVASAGLEKVGWLEFAAILILLAVVNWYMPRWKPVSRVLALKGTAEKAVAVLSILSSISFIGGAKAASQVNDEVQRRRNQYQAAWERQKMAEIETELIPQIEQTWASANAAERSSIVRFAALAGSAGGEVQARVLENVINSETRSAARSDPPAAPGIDALSTRPGSLAEARSEPAILAKQEQKASAAEASREETWKAAETILAEGVASLVPGRGSAEVIGFAKAYVSIDAGRIFAGKIRPRLEKTDWIPAHWKSAVYDSATGKSALTESVRQTVAAERAELAARIQEAARQQRIESERRAIEEARPAERGIP